MSLNSKIRSILEHCKRRLALPRAGKEFVLIVAGQVGVFLGGIASVRVLTELLPPSAYGTVALALTMVQLAIQILLGGLAQAFGRLLTLAIEAGAINSYFRSVRVTLKNATFALSALGGFVILFLAAKTSISVAFSTNALALAVVSGWIVSINAIQNSARERMVVSAHIVLDTWLRLLFTVLMVKSFGGSALAAIAGYLISAVVVFGSHIFFLTKTIQKLTVRYADANVTQNNVNVTSWTRQALEFAWPFSAWGVFTWVQQASDRWALQVFSSQEAVGQYMVLYQLGYGPISMAVGMLISLISPIIFQRAGDGSDVQRTSAVADTINKATIFAIFATLIGFCLLLSAHQLAFQLSVGQNYRMNSWLLPWMWLAGGAFAVGQILSLQPLVDLAVKKLLVPKIATAIIGVGFNIFGAVVAGLPGVVFAQLGFSVLYVIWILALNFRSQKRQA